MNTKRAFTLIELLVVIAIIAILAAILFPVFAQAKLAAKKSGSLSNVKQITLANLMYENDYDDYFVLETQNFYDSGCGTTSSPAGSYFCREAPYASTPGWDLLLQPYIKSLGLFVDPATGDPQGIFGSGPNAIPAFQNGAAQYAYNYVFLAPISIVASVGGWVPPGATYAFSAVGQSQTQGVHPATTVMFTAAQGSQWVVPTGQGTGGHMGAVGQEYQTPDDDAAVPPGIGYQMLEATDRLELVGGTSGAPEWVGQWVKNTPVGELTASTRALFPYTGSPTGFVDGHAKSMTADALAAGTDFGTSTTTENHGNGCVVTNVANYIWTLDGTLGQAGNSSAFPSGY